VTIALDEHVVEVAGLLWPQPAQADPDIGPILYEIIATRYEKKATAITSNKSLTEWGRVLHDSALAAALVESLLHHGEVYSLKGDGYRLRGKPRPAEPRLGWSLAVQSPLVAARSSGHRATVPFSSRSRSAFARPVDGLPAAVPVDVAEGHRPRPAADHGPGPGDQYHWGASSSFRIATKAARPPHRPVRVGVKPDVCRMARRHSMLGGHQFNQSPFNSLAG
jgi:hypothetical protein